MIHIYKREKVIDFRVDQETLDKVHTLSEDKERMITEKNSEKRRVLRLFGTTIGRQNFFPLYRITNG